MSKANLINLKLPRYTRSEEIFNTVSHIAGVGFGVVALLTCVIVAAFNQNKWGIVSGVIYGFTVILLFTMSSIYHGLNGLTNEILKKIFRVIDHSTIFTLIAGSYTPVILNNFRAVYPVEAWTILAIIWGLAIFGIVLNFTDLERFKVLSMVCYIGMGWLAMPLYKKLIDVYGITFFALILIAGIVNSAGAILYVIGKKKKYMHSVFHVFVDIAALINFLGIAVYVMPI